MLFRSQAPAGAHFPWPTKEAVDCLMGHDWPGNARELGNVLQRAIVLRESEQIGLADLHMTARPIMSSPAAAMPVEPTLAEPVRRAGRPTRLQDVARLSKLDAIRAALAETGGHRARAASKLGISERTLRYRLAEMRELAAA